MHTNSNTFCETMSDNGTCSMVHVSYGLFSSNKLFLVLFNYVVKKRINKYGTPCNLF